MATFDDLLEEAGPFGRCQKRILALLCLVSLPFSAVYVGVVFQAFTPEHWCREPVLEHLEQVCGWTATERRRITLPSLNVSGKPQPSSCEQYEVDWNFTKISCEMQQFNLSRAPKTSCKDGWEYDYEGRRSLVTEFDLVCSKGWIVDLYQAALSTGFLFSSFVFGYFTDRFGRRLGMLVSNLVSVVSVVALAVAPSVPIILLVRLVLGFSVKGGWVTAFVLLTEVVGVKHRRTVSILFQMFFSLGFLLLPLLAFTITDWRWLHAITMAPCFLFLSYYWLVPESPRWLLSQSRAEEAQRILDAFARENHRRLSKQLTTVSDGEGRASSGSLMDLVRTPNMRRHTLILMFTWFTSAVVYQGLVMLIGISGGNVYLDFFIAALVECPATIVIIFTIERIGRRLPFAAANIVSGASCIIAAFIPDTVYWLKLLVASVGRMAMAISFQLVIFVNTELFPTFIRSLGVSVCSTLSDVGGVLAPFLLYRFASFWLELPLVIFGVVASVAGLLVLLLPETKGRPLPETISDVEFPQRNQREENQEENQEEKQEEKLLKCEKNQSRSDQ